MNKIHKKQGKTTAKSLGLKSVLKVEDNLIVSTFGKQTNPMIVEQSINKETGEKDYYVSEEQRKFESKLDKNNNYLKLVSVEHNNHEINIKISNESQSEIGMDYLRLKPVFEKEMFDKTYNDNVHIQIAYNILDLKKIIGLHVGNVIQSLMNLSRVSNDSVGLFFTDVPLDKLDEGKKINNLQYLRNLTPYFMYFDGALKKMP